MNTGSFTSGFQQQGNSNTYPNSSYCQQTTSNSATHGAQNTHIRAPLQSTTQYPGTPHPLPSQYPGPNQQLSQHPGTNRQSSRHPGTNPFFAQHPTTIHFPDHSGANQYTTQFPGNSQVTTRHPGQCQFRGTSQHSAASKIPRPPFFTGKPPFWGAPRYPGNNQASPDTTRFCPPQFQHKTTQLRDETQYTSEKGRQSPVSNSTTNQLPINFHLTHSTSFSTQTQAANVFQFSGPRRKPVCDNSQSLREDTDSETLRKENKEQVTEVKLSDEVQRRQMEKERITNLIRIQHLISSYAKVRNLGVLCQDFKTPVFGDFPQGNEVEKGIMRNLSHFLKEEIKKIKFLDLAERGHLTFGKCNEDPILRASFPVIRSTITRLEIKKNGLANEKKKIETLEKETKAFSDELEIREAEAKTLRSEVEAEKARLEKLNDRQKTERKNNEAVRLQFGQEMEEINQIQIHSLHENLRALQEKISKETKSFNQKKEEVQNMKEQNDSLRLRIYF